MIVSKKIKKRRTLEEKTFHELVKILDAEYSLHIRRRDKFKCICCGYRGYEKDGKLDCGHYFSRNLKSVRWNEDNTHCQCKKCNYIHMRNKEKYTIALLNKIGKDRFATLTAKANQLSNFSRNDLILLIRYFKTLNHDYEKKKIFMV